MKREELEKLYWETADCGMPSNGIFEEYYGHLQQTLLRGKKGSRNGTGGRTPELSPELLNIFTKQMQRITLRTLIFEMEICEEDGKLKGETIEERYKYFGEIFLRDMDHKKEIYEEYPVLYESMLRTLEDFVRNIEELSDRFTKDREGINQRFYSGNPCGEIRQIGGGSSDSHRHGQRIFILELDNGEKLVYKPRNLAIDEAYETFLKWVFENVGMSCWWYQVWNKEKYGWCQWVSSVPCSSHEELGRYYYRNGMLLCVGYLLGSEDMHYENLIAHGEYPVIVDLEMAVGSRGTRMKKELTGTESFYQGSVLQTGLLPLYTWNEEGQGVNVGAINGKGGQLIPVVMPVVVNPGTVKMHIEYRRPVMREGKNLATLNGKFVEPYEFLEEIQKGFERAYTFLMEQQKETLEMLGLFRSVPIRCLVRDTQQYSMLLMTLGHPDLLIKAPNRQAVWEALERGIEHEESAGWILEQERQELLQGDIPYFYYTACKRELCSGTGGIWKEYFDDTAMQCMANRLKHMCDTDLECQEKLIRGAILIGTKRMNEQKVERLGGTGISDRNLLLGKNLESHRIMAAEKIADILLKEAIWSEDGREVGWISIMMAGYREKSYMIRPMNFYLYGGLAGVAVFMANLAGKTGKAKYCDVGNILVKSLFRHTDDLFQKEKRRKLSTGAYSGEASIAFAYMLMYSVSGDPVFLPYLRKQCQATAERLADDQEYDILGGNAGAILVFLKAYHLTGEKQYMEWAREAGECLLQSATSYGYGMGWVNQAVGVALTGFAHGTAGIMLALARLGHDTQEEKYLEAAYQAYQYEENYDREELQDWEDLRNERLTVQESQSMAWCHGWGGIVMARMAAIRYVKGSFKPELEKIKYFVRRKANSIDYRSDVYQGANLCLCHGRCGNTALLWKFGKKEEATLMQSQLIETICCGKTSIQGLLELQECVNYGLLGGIAGIGYSCLCNPGKVLELLCIDYGGQKTTI